MSQLLAANLTFQRHPSESQTILKMSMTAHKRRDQDNQKHEKSLHYENVSRIIVLHAKSRLT